MADMIITIDGPAGSGKSTVARRLAVKLGAKFLDTGAMYRAVTLAAMQAGIDMNDQQELLDVLERSKFHFSVNNDQIFVEIDGVNVTERIREPDVTEKAHFIASAQKIRAKLVDMQRDFACDLDKVVTEGRDQGTVAFPQADIKFFLTADPVERAKRRLAELRARGGNETLEQVQQAIEKRDHSDINRDVGPLRPAEDAVIVDTTDLDIDSVVEKLLECVKRNV